MNCIVVDDNKLASAVLEHLITQIDFLTLKKTFSNSLEAYTYLKKEPVDLVFMDVEMEGMNGLELVKNLDKRPIVIFTTAKKDYAVDAFELNVADYILKPLAMPRFMLAVSKAKDLFDKSNQTSSLNSKNIDYIFVRSNSVLSKVKITDIIYVQASGDYVNIYTKTKRYTVHITLRGIEAKLPPEKFYRLHRSYLVALDQVDAVEEDTAYLEKHPVPIGEQFKKDLLKKLNLI
jgi:two-component system, LytTR family, response regulator